MKSCLKNTKLKKDRVKTDRFYIIVFWGIDSAKSGQTLSTTIAYSNNFLTTTFTKPDRKTIAKTLNTFGAISETTDQGGTINYSYYSDLQLKKTKVNNIDMNLVTYDDYGRQNALIDKNAGATYTKVTKVLRN